MAANWSRETHKLGQIPYQCRLPCIVQVSEGICSTNEVATMSGGDIMKIDKHTWIPKVAANFAPSNSNHPSRRGMVNLFDSEVFVPLKYQGKVKIVNELKCYKSIEELVEDLPRYVKLMKPLTIDTERKERLTIPTGTRIELERVIPGLKRKELKDPDKLIIMFEMKGTNYTVAVPVDRPGQFRILPDEMEYTLKEVIQRYELPQVVEFLQNDLRKVYIESLRDVEGNVHTFTDTLRLNRVVVQEVLIGRYKPLKDLETLDTDVSHIPLVLLPLDSDILRELEVNVLQDATENDYETFSFMRDPVQTVDDVDEMIYVDYVQTKGLIRLNNSPEGLPKPPAVKDSCCNFPPPPPPRSPKPNHGQSDDYDYTARIAQEQIAPTRMENSVLDEGGNSVPSCSITGIDSSGPGQLDDYNYMARIAHEQVASSRIENSALDEGVYKIPRSSITGIGSSEKDQLDDYNYIARIAHEQVASSRIENSALDEGVYKIPRSSITGIGSSEKGQLDDYNYMARIAHEQVASSRIENSALDEGVYKIPRSSITGIGSSEKGQLDDYDYTARIAEKQVTPTRAENSALDGGVSRVPSCSITGIDSSETDFQPSKRKSSVLKMILGPIYTLYKRNEQTIQSSTLPRSGDISKVEGEQKKHVQPAWKRYVSQVKSMVFDMPQSTCSNESSGEQSFKTLSASQLYERLKKCGMHELAEQCRSHTLDGQFLSTTDINTFRNEPFNLLDFDITKLKKVKKNWIPR